MDAFSASYLGQSEPDGFNALVMGADLDWRDVTVLRAIGRYLRQVGVDLQPDLCRPGAERNVDIARQLVSFSGLGSIPDWSRRQGSGGRRPSELRRQDQEGAQRRGQS